MRSASFVLSGLVLFATVFAAPSPPGNEISSQKRQAWADGCSPKNLACDCMGVNFDCGYVDEDWHTPAPGPPVKTSRSLDAANRGSAAGRLDRRQAKPVPAGPPPQVVIEPDPLKAALLDLDANITLGHGESFRIIRNRYHEATRGQFLQGIAGNLNMPVTIRGVLINATTQFVGQFSLRWNFAWYGPNGELPATRLLGPYVDLFASLNDEVVHIAYFFPSNAPINTAPQVGDYYYANILDPLRTFWEFNGSTNAIDSPTWQFAYEWRSLVVPPSHPFNIMTDCSAPGILRIDNRKPRPDSRCDKYVVPRPPPPPPKVPSWLLTLPPGLCAYPPAGGPPVPSVVWCTPNDTRKGVFQPGT